jgi:uncharacterized protein (TIGR00730 family)
VKRLCVFCGSSPGNDPIYLDAARRFGALLAERGLGLVYGGGDIGLMGALADAVLAGGGEVIGVIPRALVKREVAHFGLSDLRIVGSMHDRKALMADLADAFVALPGGLGTLEELCEILTWAQLGIHDKPCGLLDVRGYFAPFLAFLDHVVDTGFMSRDSRALLVVADAPERLLDAIQRYAVPRRERWLDDEQR